MKKVDWWLPHASWGIETLLEEFFNCQFFDHMKYCQLAKKILPGVSLNIKKNSKYIKHK